jgi:hypothetical protein
VPVSRVSTGIHTIETTLLERSFLVIDDFVCPIGLDSPRESSQVSLDREVTMVNFVGRRESDR